MKASKKIREWIHQHPYFLATVPNTTWENTLAHFEIGKVFYLQNNLATSRS